MGNSRYKVQGTRKLQATGDPSLKSALHCLQTQISGGSLPFCGSWKHAFKPSNLSRAISAADEESGEERIGRMDFHSMNHVSAIR